jgi:osmotically-inducible protein OsmY
MTHLYAVVLNLSRMSPDNACETLAQLAERDEFQPTAPSAKAMRDLTLSSLVSAALATDFRTRDADLKVAADDGVVTIAGTTPWSEVVDAVPVVVRGVEGVKEVRSEIAGVTPLHPLAFY